MLTIDGFTYSDEEVIEETRRLLMKHHLEFLQREYKAGISKNLKRLLKTGSKKKLEKIQIYDLDLHRLILSHERYGFIYRTNLDRASILLNQHIFHFFASEKSWHCFFCNMQDITRYDFDHYPNGNHLSIGSHWHYISSNSHSTLTKDYVLTSLRSDQRPASGAHIKIISSSKDE